jgi:hypothetical protein
MKFHNKMLILLPKNILISAIFIKNKLINWILNVLVVLMETHVKNTAIARYKSIYITQNYQN